MANIFDDLSLEKLKKIGNNLVEASSDFVNKLKPSSDIAPSAQNPILPEHINQKLQNIETQLAQWLNDQASLTQAAHNLKKEIASLCQDVSNFYKQNTPAQSNEAVCEIKPAASCEIPKKSDEESS